jgi:hypothetical protein
VHLDLGLSSLGRYADEYIEINAESGVSYIKFHLECPYYLVKTTVKDRNKGSFLPHLLNSINRDV